MKKRRSKIETKKRDKRKGIGSSKQKKVKRNGRRFQKRAGKLCWLFGKFKDGVGCANVVQDRERLGMVGKK